MGKPKRYVCYPPLLLLPTNFKGDLENAPEWLSDTKCTHLAQNAEITEDRQRHPAIRPLVGDFGTFVSAEPLAADFETAFWVSVKQNGIYQTWAPLYTMFSRGNVTEKARVLAEFPAQAPVAGSLVLDLYAGIGYFTLCYAKLGARVFGWEINPWSVEGLRRAALANRFSVQIVAAGQPFVDSGAQVVVFCEDNQHAATRLAEYTGELAGPSHINMGLLPDCHDAWPLARQLAQKGSIIHVHENVPATQIEEWAARSQNYFGPCLHVEHIKQYAPRVIHVCGDFAFSPAAQ